MRRKKNRKPETVAESDASTYTSNSMNQPFRSARVADTEALLDLVRDFHIEEHLAYEREAVRRILSDLIQRPEFGQVWVLEHSGHISGYALVGYGYSIEYRGRDAFIDELYIVPGERKKGLGMRFLEWIRDEARAAGISVIHLEVDNSNERAYEIYQAFGFKPKNRRMMSLWPDT